VLGHVAAPCHKATSTWRFTTPLVAKHGERVRIRIMDFVPMRHHPVHIHGHSFWITGHEGRAFRILHGFHETLN
jgi:FtsP/CotA-like multicopper oxidase with cupredoxin domain